MKSKVVLALALLAVLAAAAVVYAHGAAPYVGKKPVDAGKKGSKGQNATVYITTREITLRGEGIEAAVKVDVVNRNSTWPYGKVIFGSGQVKLGDATYSAKTIYGAVGPRGARLVVYTGGEIIEIRYRDGMYIARVKTAGQPGYKTYSGSAQLTIS